MAPIKLNFSAYQFLTLDSASSTNLAVSTTTFQDEAYIISAKIKWLIRNGLT